jgi:hypothetical protein
MSRVGSIGAVMAINQLNQMGNPEAANKLMFLQWLRTQQPGVYSAAMKVAMARNGLAPPTRFGDLPNTYGAFHQRGGRRWAYNGEGLGRMGDAITANDRNTRRFYDGQGLGFTQVQPLNPARSMSGEENPKSQYLPLMAGITDIVRAKSFNSGMGALADYSSYTSPSYTTDQISAMASTPVDLSAATAANAIPAINTSTGTVTTTSEGTTPQFSASSLASTFSTLTSIAGSVAKIINPSSQNIVALNAQRAAQGLPPLNADGTVMTPAQLAAAGYTSAQITAMEAALAASGSTTLTVLGLPWYLWAGGAAALLFVLAQRRS